MNAIQQAWVSTMCVTVLGACASEPVSKPVEAVHRGSGVEMAELRRVTGCAKGEVLVCIEVNCRPENYTCSEARDVRRMFGVRAKH